jgi:hypothetical protein
MDDRRYLRSAAASGLLHYKFSSEKWEKNSKVARALKGFFTTCIKYYLKITVNWSAIDHTSELFQ